MPLFLVITAHILSCVILLGYKIYSDSDSYLRRVWKPFQSTPKAVHLTLHSPGGVQHHTAHLNQHEDDSSSSRSYKAAADDRGINPTLTLLLKVIQQPILISLLPWLSGFWCILKFCVAFWCHAEYILFWLSEVPVLQMELWSAT